MKIISIAQDIDRRTAALWAASRGAPRFWAVLPWLYWDIAPHRGGVNPAVAFAQACKETGFGSFGRAVTRAHHNPCGLKVPDPAGKADDDPDAHKKFGSWTLGVRAHCDHLALYAGADGYPREQTPDPRHFDFLFGVAARVEDLGGKWAPADDYGESIIEDFLAPMRRYGEDA